MDIDVQNSNSKFQNFHFENEWRVIFTHKSYMGVEKRRRNMDAIVRWRTDISILFIEM